MSQQAISLDEDNYLRRELYAQIKSDDRIFDFLQAASLDGIWYWDLENLEQEWMSPSFWRLFGVDPAMKRHLASEWQDIIHPDDLAMALDNFNKHLADPEHPYDQIVRYRHTDGSTVTVRCRGLIIRDDDGKPVRMLGAHNDLTELKRAQDDLAKANAALEEQLERAKELVQLKSNFLSLMSHEIRTPLNAIIGLFEIIETTTTDQPQKARAAKGLIAAERLFGLLTKVLDAAQLELDMIEARVCDVDLQSLRDQVASLLEGSVAKSGRPIDIRIEWSKELPGTIETDQGMLEQIFANLIDNAVRFTDKGHVKVRAVAVLLGNQRAVRFDVEDTGVGISPEEQSVMYEPFNQIDGSITRKVGGSGLGLSITRQLVNCLGGQISVESEVGKGTTFSVTLFRDGAKH